MPGAAQSSYRKLVTGTAGLLAGAPSMAASECLSGALLSLFMGHSALRGSLRLMRIGSGAGIAAWAVGRPLGAGMG